MKFAAHRNSGTLVGHYLDDMSNVDGAAAFLNLEPRRDLTEDFRSASMKRNPNLRHSLPTKSLGELKQRRDYINLSEQIEDLSVQVTSATTEEARKELKARRHCLYKQRQKLIDEELANYQQRVNTTRCEIDDQGEWHRSYFERVVRHMVPERDRLARTLSLAAPLRSPEGISALRDLIALLRNDSRVAYQEVLRPIEGCCPVPNCGKVIKE
jgi:molecular chaperone GrpE (heat shock protein)